ncbi:predicted protein [Lichtheimia corymbifera JMRC:FSU:9682]|uniref:Uncharacterized protein n=1 Tax=Lichtheimia corymbifera JMRC:FSU:9682 TaxID=1263082 RepID=A0A068SE48_9FUNG|nr:predicted protein [Lichtheimia corymbifera JMRC:FSU:9682]
MAYGKANNQGTQCKRLLQIPVILAYYPVDGVAIKVIFREGVSLSIRLHQDIPIQARWSDDSLLAFAEVAIGGDHIPQHTYGTG